MSSANLEDIVDAIDDSLRSGKQPDDASLASQFAADPDAVANCMRGLRALQFALDEDEHIARDAPPDLPTDYQLRGELGRGGMGVVYRAFQQSLQREVALKVLRPGELMFGAAMQRFRHEAQSLAKLRHPHIVSVHEVGEADGHVYFTMDLVDGRTLTEVIREGRMTITQSVRLLQQICAAMSYAHGQGVVHRDLKPANILVAEREEGTRDAFVVDFGLARDVGAAAAYTVSGQMLGTPGYMSPEQALGDTHMVGERSDVYAIGVMLYECLAGKAPFHGMPLVHMMHAVVSTDPQPLHLVNPNVPRDLSAICAKAMRKDPLDRFATVGALAKELARFESGQPTITRPPTLGNRLFRIATKKQRLVAAVSLLLTTAALATYLLIEPMIRSGIWVDQARELLAAGNAREAVAFFERGLGPGELRLGPIDVAVEYGAALNRYAATALTGDSSLTPHDAEMLARRAELILRWWGEPTLLDEKLTTAAGEVPSIREQARVEWIRARAWTGSFLAAPNPDSAAWQWPSMDIAKRTSMPLFLRDEELRQHIYDHPGLGRELLISGFDHFDALPKAVQDEFERRCCAPWFQHLAITTTGEMERRLVHHIRSGSDRIANMAASVLQEITDTKMWGAATVNDKLTFRLVREECDELANAYEHMQSLSPLEARREAVRLTAAQVRSERLHAMNTNRLTSFALRTSGAIPSARVWKDFWEKQQHNDPRQWILDYLTWDIDLETLSIEVVMDKWTEVIERQRRGGKHYGRDGWYGALARLVLPRGQERPVRDDYDTWMAVLARNQ